jgi:hypothetical protein
MWKIIRVIVLFTKETKSSVERFLFLVLISLLFYNSSLYAFEPLTLLYNPIMKPPTFQKPKVVYEMDFVFDKILPEYVLFYDHIQKKLVIDFYGASVFLLDSAKTKTFSGELIVRNVETTMSLFGQKGQILFTLQKEWNFEQGWHYESSIISQTTLRVKLWIELRPAVTVKRKTKEVSEKKP